MPNLGSFLDELQKIGRATITATRPADTKRIPPMQTGMYEFGGTPYITAEDRPGYSMGPLPEMIGQGKR